ncbi:MAG TPA: hypothetical protein VG838_13940 [Opitutaceae bacterium]|nr:hypothetical protein [Opitutaceae bacterium]
MAASHRVEFFRLPAPGKRDPFFGLSRGWYYKAAAAGEIKMVALRQRGALRGVRLVAYDSVCDYIRRAAEAAHTTLTATASSFAQLPADSQVEGAQG